MTPASPGKPPRADGLPRVDPRAPFAFCVAEGWLLIGLLAILAGLDVPALPLIGLGCCLLYLLTAGASLLAYAVRFSRIRAAAEEAERLNADIYRMFRTSVDIPYAVVNGDGVALVVNAAMQRILSLRSAVCSLPIRDLSPDLNMERISASARRRDGAGSALFGAETEEEAAPDRPVRLCDGRRYRAEPYLMRRGEDSYYLLLFRDVSDFLDLTEEVGRNHVVFAYIVLDNLQELTQFVRANYRETANRIEATLRRWVEGMRGMIREYDRDKYLALFSSEMLDRCAREEFPILGEIMNIRVGDNSFPVSVSMGIADIDGSMGERERAADAALDMALQRGGNQVALQRRGAGGPVFYGGAHRTIESNTSVSSRVGARLIAQRLAASDNVLMMTHANPDFDAVGSAVGMYRLCRSILADQGRGDVPVRVVMDRTCDTFRLCAAHLAAIPDYGEAFIDRAAALQTLTADTVLILTDVSNPAIFEAPELVNGIAVRNGASSIAVIDHHRLVGELPFVPFLHYIETTKSSASEIVAEILEQSDYAGALLKEEANLLLAGIMLDTHNFTRSAGAQTFGVARYLYSRNAHTGAVREFFSERLEDMRAAGDFDAHTELYAGVCAVTWPGAGHVPSPDDRVAASKAADKLLSLRGVEASFALVPIGGAVAVSARSKGRINVQLIMEKLEGGGHFDMAGAQIGGGVEEVYELLCDAIDEYRLQFPELFERDG